MLSVPEISGRDLFAHSGLVPRRPPRNNGTRRKRKSGACTSVSVSAALISSEVRRGAFLYAACGAAGSSKASGTVSAVAASRRSLWSRRISVTLSVPGISSWDCFAPHWPSSCATCLRIARISADSAVSARYSGRSCLSSPAPNCFQVTVSRPVAPPATDFISAGERPPRGARVPQSADARHAALESTHLRSIKASEFDGDLAWFLVQPFRQWRVDVGGAAAGDV